MKPVTTSVSHWISHILELEKNDIKILHETLQLSVRPEFIQIREQQAKL